jgi:hypothetical protein
LSLILLSASLSNLQLHAGAPFPSADAHNAFPKTAPGDDRVYSFHYLQGLLGLFLLLLMFYIPARLLLFIKLRWLFRVLQILMVLLVATVLLSLINFDTNCNGDACSGIGIVPPPAAPLVLAEGPSPRIIYGLAIGLGLAAVALLFRIAIRLRPSPRKNGVLEHARTAAQEIRLGRDFRNVIIQCYSQMSAALQKEKGIERSGNMTSHEFEDLLISSGFPSGPVHELTQLFEKVRYGHEPPNKSDETSALASLDTIIHFAEGGLHE